MNESVARDVVLMSAIELSDQDRSILSDEDRRYANRSASDLAHWAASDQIQPMSPELFLEKRAELILKKVGERHPGFSRFTRRRNTFRSIGIALPFLAFLAGFLIDRIADPHRVDLLSPPLLLILAWNLAVYAGLLAAPLIPPLKRLRLPDGMLDRITSGKRSPPRKLPQALVTAGGRFAAQWALLSRPLTLVRSKRIFHLSAAAFAAGAVLSLYVRGIVTQYRAGWESTFLDAGQVHGLLDLLFAPAIALFRIEGFTLAEITALQFAGPASATGGERWVHLYAATLLLAVILPRVVLALAARWQERRLASHFPIDLAQPYFRKLTQGIGGTAAAVLRIFPYSFTVDEIRQRNLQVVAKMLLGEQAVVMLRPSTAYGESPPEAVGQATLREGEIALTALLINLSATPERENHGEFLDFLAKGAAGPVLALIDESIYLTRLGEQAGSDVRLRERINLWREFCELHEIRPIIVNLLDPSSRATEIENGFDALARPA